MERAYAQARSWPADRAWRRAYVQMAEGQIASGMGMYMCLLNYYARRDGIKDLFDTCEWILTRMADLRPQERLSVSRIVCHIVKSLKEDEFDVHEARLKLILRIPLAVILEAVAEGRLSCALTALLEFSRVFEESVTLKKCSEFEGDFLGVALAIDRATRAGCVRDKVKASEKSREEYDRERMEAMNMADAIKDKIGKMGALFSSSAQQATPESEEDVSSADRDAYQKPLDKLFPAAANPRDAAIVADAQRLLTARSNANTALEKFGLNSEQFAHRLADLIVVQAENFSEVTLDESFKLLDQIMKDENTDISPYVLRKVLASVGRADEKRELLSMLASIEESILLKKEKCIGLDVSLGITLWRLVWLWYKNDCLIEGSAFCKVLLERLLPSCEAEHFAVRQVMSASQFIINLLTSAVPLQFGKMASSKVPRIDDAVEFPAMLATIALDDIIHGRSHSAELVMNELLCFYSDTVGDASRKVGEMFWLLQETCLNQLRKPSISLVHQSQKFAWDEYLSSRLKENARRLLSLLSDDDYKREIVSSLILARGSASAQEDFEKAMSETKEWISFCTYQRNYVNEAEEERKKIKENEMQKSKSNVLMVQLEQHADKQDWKRLATAFKKDRKLIEIKSSFYRLVQIGVHAASANQFTLCESIIGWLDSETSFTYIHAFNYLVEEMKRMLIASDQPEYAAIIIQNALQNRFQTQRSGNRFRLQLAEIKAMTGNLFESSALIYQAFSEIPDWRYESDPPLLPDIGHI